jgi:hypothetical protein
VDRAGLALDALSTGGTSLAGVTLVALGSIDTFVPSCRSAAAPVSPWTP